jgi:drug/metabolite transporter (DMT)-like permease
MLIERTSRPPARLPVVAAFTAIYLFWGSNFLAIRFAVETIPPFVLMGVRSLIAGVCLLAWGAVRGEFRVTPRQLSSAAAAGMLLFVVGHGGLAWAQRSVPSSIAALVMATIPLWMVLLEWALGATAPRPMTWMGLASGLAGIALLTTPSSHGGATSLSPLAVGVMLLSAFGWASGSVAARRMSLPSSVAVTTGLQLTFGGAALCALAWAAGSWSTPIHPSWRSIIAMLYMIVFASIVTLTAYVWLLRVSTPARVGSYAFVNPVVAVFMGWAFAGEMFTGRMLVAAAVIVLGVVLIVSPAPGRARTRTT